MVVSLPLTLCQMGQVEGINMKGVIQQEYALSWYIARLQSITSVVDFAQIICHELDFFFPLMKPLASLEWWKNRDALFSLVICLNTDLIWQFIFNMLKQDLKASMHGPPIMNPPTLRTSVLSY